MCPCTYKGMTSVCYNSHKLQTRLVCKVTVLICVLAVLVCSLQLKHPSTMHRLSLSPQQWMDSRQMIHHQYLMMTGMCSTHIVQVLDGDGKKGYKVHKLRTSKHFISSMEIKDQLQESHKEHISCNKFDIGYIEAGRQGVREEINDMYKSYKSASKTEIILWCDGRKQISGKKGHPLLQKKMKAAIKNRKYLLGCNP